MDTPSDVGKTADSLQLHSTKITIAIQEKCARQRFCTLPGAICVFGLLAMCYSEPTAARPNLAST